MKLKCPHCGNESETDVELVDGQHVRCPFCNEKSVYGENADQPGDVVGAAAKAAIDAAKTAADAASKVGRKVYHRIQVEDWAADRQKVGEAAARARKAVGDGYAKGNELMDKVPILKTKRAKLTVWILVSIVLLCFLRSCMSGGEDRESDKAENGMHGVASGADSNKEQVRHRSESASGRKGGPAYEEYVQQKRWYQEQLEYNGWEEFCFEANIYEGKRMYSLTFSAGIENIQIVQTTDGTLTFPRQMPVGFAKKLLHARIAILRYECPEAKDRSVIYSFGQKCN